jgi:hypothetical protein
MLRGYVPAMLRNGPKCGEKRGKKKPKLLRAGDAAHDAHDALC